LTRSVGT